LTVNRSLERRTKLGQSVTGSSWRFWRANLGARAWNARYHNGFIPGWL
jgi:hypothetical protein